MSTVSIKCRSCIILHSLPSSTLISLQILQLCVQWYSPCFSVPENGALCLPGLLPDDSQLLSCSSCSQAICLPRRVARNWRDRPGLWPDLRKPRHHVARAWVRRSGASLSKAKRPNLAEHRAWNPSQKHKLVTFPEPCRLGTCPGSCPIEVVWTTRRWKGLPILPAPGVPATTEVNGLGAKGGVIAWRSNGAGAVLATGSALNAGTGCTTCPNGTGCTGTGTGDSSRTIPARVGLRDARPSAFNMEIKSSESCGAREAA